MIPRRETQELHGLPAPISGLLWACTGWHANVALMLLLALLQASAALLQSLPPYTDLTAEVAPGRGPAWLTDNVQASRVQFLMAMLTPCMGHLQVCRVNWQPCFIADLFAVCAAGAVCCWPLQSTPQAVLVPKAVPPGGCYASVSGLAPASSTWAVLLPPICPPP